MSETSPRAELIRLLAVMDPSNVDFVVDAIEALIHEKLTEAMNMMADKIQDATGVRP